MKPTSIIIIDDHTLLRETWEKFLSFRPEYKIVLNTADSKAALDTIKAEKIDMVLLDITMQPLDGFCVLKMIRECAPTTRVIGVSMHTQVGFAKKLIRMGARGYVTKSSSTDELLLAMNEVAAGRMYICTEIKNGLSKRILEGPVADGIDSLTNKQIEIIGLMQKGYTSQDIANQLSVSRKTVETHKHTIFKRLQVRNSLSLIKIAYEHGL